MRAPGEMGSVPGLTPYFHELDHAGQAQLFDLLLRPPEADGVLICAGDVAPARLALRGDVVTQLAAGVTYPLQVLADEEKVGAVTRHAAERGFRLGREVIDYLLRRQDRDPGADADVGGARPAFAGNQTLPHRASAVRTAGEVVRLLRQEVPDGRKSRIDSSSQGGNTRRRGVGVPRSGQQGRESWRVKVPPPSIARFGRLAYPLLGEVTDRDMRGGKSHGCPV